MSAIVVSKVMRPQRRDIYSVIMDDYGAEMHVSTPVTMAKADRDAKVKAAITAMDNGQSEMEAQAKVEGMDISALKTAGLAKRAARMEGGQK